MRLGFDLSPLHRPHPPGVVRATRELASALAAALARGGHELVELAPGPDEDLRAWRRGLGRAVEREELVGLHSPVSAFAWRGAGKRVQTIHELPWRHGVRENADLAHRLWAALGPLRADRVVCPTEHVARDLRRRRLPGASRIAVIAWGVGAPFADEPPPGVVDEVVLGRYSLDESPFALCLGAVRPKKNLAAVLRGVAALHARGTGARLNVLVTGPVTAQLRRDLGLVSQLGLARWVSTPGIVAEEDLPSLLRLATVVPVLSHSEGFGLPALEALASGTPALVARDSGPAEVTGAVGILCDPADPESVADGLARALAEREALRFACAERAAAFPWSRAGERVAELWRELAGESTGESTGAGA